MTAGRIDRSIGRAGDRREGFGLKTVSTDLSVQRRLAELDSLAHGDSVSDAVAVAIAVEHSFGIVLADDDIIPERLCSPEALAQTVCRCLDGA
jgi:hypothetical protein